MDLLSAASSDGSGAVPFVLLFVAALYLLPTIIAFKRGVPNRGSVLVLNLFLGWTFFGWIVSLSLACGSKGQIIEVNNFHMQSGPQMAAPSGWFPDPSGVRGAERYYDGFQWTPETRPAAIY